jgi:hypothetical protein
VSSTATNKQPLLVDRPLVDSVRVTTQTVGSQATNTLFVQGGQVPSILVDMDAALSEDNNNGGVIDSILISRNDKFRGNDYTLNATNKDSIVSLSSGQVVFMEDPTQATVSSNNYQYGHYTYTGAATLTGILKAFNYSGALAQGFTYQGVAYGNQPEVTFVFYHTRATTTPIPASGDYDILFAKTVPANVTNCDCSDVMPHVSTPGVHSAYASATGDTRAGLPIRNRGIYLERGDRLYVGVYAEGPNTAGYTPGVNVTAHGGFF